MDNRRHDREVVEKGLKSKDPSARKQAEMAKERIRAESGESKKMRGELVDAHRSGNQGKVKELHHKLQAENRRVKKQVEKYYGGRSSF